MRNKIVSIALGVMLFVPTLALASGFSYVPTEEVFTQGSPVPEIVFEDGTIAEPKVLTAAEQEKLQALYVELLEKLQLLVVLLTNETFVQ